MDAPQLHLVPPTPLEHDFSSPSPSTSSTSSSPTAPSRFSAIGKRPSSQTTIFSIYSMYGDERPRESWSAEGSPAEADRKSSGSMVPTVSLTLPDNRHSSYYRPTSSVGSTELPYYDPDAPGSSHGRTGSPVIKPTVSMNGTANGLSGVALFSRPASSYVPPPSSMRGSTFDLEERRASTGQSSGQSFRTSATSSFATGASRSRETSHNPSNHSRHSSQAGHHDPRSDTANRELPQPPPAFPPLPRIPSSSFPPLPPLPPSQPSSLHPSPAATPPRQPSPTLQPPTTPTSLPLKHGPFAGSPSSKISLVPSEGEDLDAFHVRNTYAQLEMSGVKGDGYEEGVERTRARIGASRSSQLNALAALGDGTEKTRELEAKEIETLASVDR